jgi:hypothetical protein
MAMAAAEAAAQKKARDEARKALIISTALNQNMSSLDPKTQEELQRLLRAESRRVNQENFEWKLGWWILGGFGLFVLLLLSFGYLASNASSHVNNEGRTQYTASATATPDMTRLSRVRVGTKVKYTAYADPIPGEVTAQDSNSTSVRWDNGHNELIVYTNNDLIKQLGTGEIVITESAQSSIHSARPTPTPEPEPDMTMLLRLRVGTKVKCDGAVGVVTAKNDNSTSVRWGDPRIPSRAYSNEELAKELNTGEIVITEDGSRPARGPR